MNHPRRRHVWTGRPPDAFSMLELLIVVTILLLLTAMYWGFETRGARGQKQKSCLSNLQRLSVALDIFANDHTNAYPIAPGALTSEAPLELLVPKYTADHSGFICPASRDSALSPASPLSRQRISYAFYMGTTRSAVSSPLASDRQVNTASKLIGQPVFSPDGHSPGNNHKEDGGNVLFTDGHAEHSTAAASRALPVPPGVTLLNPKP